MYNNFTGVGNLAADPDVRYSQQGTAIANFTVCCDHGWGDNKKTEFIRCVAFKKTAELVGEYLSKGSRCMVVGAMQTRKWQDNNGNDRYTTEIVVNEVKFLGGKPEKKNWEYYTPPEMSDPPF